MGIKKITIFKRNSTLMFNIKAKQFRYMPGDVLRVPGV
jgi:hypothetical protein